MDGAHEFIENSLLLIMVVSIGIVALIGVWSKITD